MSEARYLVSALQAGCRAPGSGAPALKGISKGPASESPPRRHRRVSAVASWFQQRRPRRMRRLGCAVSCHGRATLRSDRQALLPVPFWGLEAEGLGGLGDGLAHLL